MCEPSWRIHCSPSYVASLGNEKNMATGEGGLKSRVHVYTYNQCSKLSICLVHTLGAEGFKIMHPANCSCVHAHIMHRHTLK